jgi:hypothetical protein
MSPRYYLLEINAQVSNSDRIQAVIIHSLD